MRFRAAMGALATALVLSACSDDGSDSTRLSIRLTDAQGDITTAVVTISEVYLQGDDGRVTLFDGSEKVNLTDLANEASTLVQDAVVPVGTYGQLRFVITGGCIAVEDEGVFASDPSYADCGAPTGELQMPSFGSSGLKVTLPGDRLELTSEQKILLVDFDVGQSFGHEAGNSGRWVMNPVIKGADFTLSGGLTVNVTLADGVTADLSQWKAEITGTGGSPEQLDLVDPEVDGTWTATFSYLLPDDYSVNLVPPSGTFTGTPALPTTATVSGDAGATVDVTVDSYTP